MIRVSTGRSRVAEAFARARQRGRAAFIPYLCAGDPDLSTSAALLAALGAGPADIIELGIPYSDPLADGPTIAASAQRALEAGTTLRDAIELAAGVQRAGGPPVLMFTYFNPVMQFGIESFADALLAAGACGAIVPDIPLEETDALRDAFVPRGLVLPLLIAPTTPLARAEAIAAKSDGFVYLVSRLGVTSAFKEPDFGWIAERVAALRRVTNEPLAIGFGISRAEHVRRAFEVADGAIIGSALIDSYAGTRGQEAVARVRAFVANILAEIG